VQLRIFVMLVALTTVGAMPVSGQFSSKKKDPPPSPAIPTVVTLTAQIPSLTPMAESDASQVKDGLRITLEPETYKAVQSMRDTAETVRPKGIIVVVPFPNAIYVQHTKTAELHLRPNKLVFHVHISNQLPRVFRGSGIAVQFNIAGKSTNVDPSGVGDLVNIIIPPRGEQDVTIVGPEIASIPSPCTIGIFFYDVVTKMDQAGNITDKQNFEWYYSYQTQATAKEISVPAPTVGWESPH
jgi:hypothetical protein